MPDSPQCLPKAPEAAEVEPRRVWLDELPKGEKYKLRAVLVDGKPVWEASKNKPAEIADLVIAEMHKGRS